MDKLHAALPRVVKKYVWDAKYRFLGYPKFVAPEDALLYLLPRLSEGASVLDMGCGRGSLLRALRGHGWTGSYCGVDISNEAIRDARKISDQRSSWAVSAFESFRSPFKWDTIAMIESICYIKLIDLPLFLSHAMGMLNDQGVFLLRLHDLDKHRKYIETVQRLYPHTQKVDSNLFSVTSAQQESVQSKALR